MLNLYSLYTHLLFASLALALLLIILPYNYRKNRVSRAILGTVATASGVQISMLLAMFSPTPAWAAWWHGNIRFVFYALIPLTGYIFTFCIINPHEKFIVRRLVWQSVVPLLTIVFCLTNNWHHLFFRSYAMELRQGVFIRAAWQPGPWFWVHSAYSALIGFLIFWQLIHWIQQSRRLPRLRGILIVSVVTLTVGALSVDTLGYLIAPGLLSLPLVFGLVYFLLLLGIEFLDLLDILPVAREALIRYIPDAVFIVDMHNAVLEANPAAEKIVGKPVREIIGQDIVSFIRVEQRARRAREILNGEFHAIIPLEIEGADRFLDLLVTNIYMEKEVTGAKLVILRDVTPLKSSEEALRVSEARLALALKAGAMGVWEWNFKEQTVRWDEQMLEIYGLPGPEITHEQWKQQVFPADLPQAEVLPEHFSRAKDKHITEFRIRRPDSSVRHIQSVAQAIFKNGNLEQMVGINLDITERKQAEEALRASEARYHALVEASPDAITLTDQYGAIMACNPQAAALHGFESPDEMLGANVFQLLLPEEVPLLKEQIQKAAQTGSLKSIECTMLKKDGSRFTGELSLSMLTDEQGKISGIIGISRDISERKRVADQLRQLSSAVEQSPASIMITDTSGRLEYVNLRFTQVTGYTVEELLGANPRILKSGQTPPETYRQLWKTLAAGKAWRGEFINRKKNGELYIESALISPITDAHGKITHYLAVKEDITALKELQKREVELAAVEERQRLARDLHDAVSQTLFSARLTSEMLLRQKNSLTPETLWTSLEHLTRLIISALGEMRILLLELRPEGMLNTKLSTLLVHLTDALRSRTEASIELTVQGEQTLPVSVRTALYRIAQEALNNIIKHARATSIHVTLQLDENGAQLRITDNGRGFVHQQASGGFGLDIMRERAEEIGATLTIHSQPGEGTTVTCCWKE